MSVDGPPRFNTGDPDIVEAIGRHVDTTIARVESVFHELVSDALHIDVLHVPPAVGRRFHTLVTSGMSELPMHTPDDADEFRFAELSILLEPGWRLEQSTFSDERHYWPVRLLKTLARMPFEHRTWLGFGHTTASADPPEPYAPDTALCAAMVLPPMTLGEPFSRMTRADGASTYFWSVVPLYEQELRFKMEHGTDALLERFDAAGVTDLVSRDRADFGQKKPRGRWWPFGRG